MKIPVKPTKCTFILTAQLLGNKGTDIFETTRQAYLVTFEGLQNLDQHLRSVAERHGNAKFRGRFRLSLLTGEVSLGTTKQLQRISFFL